MNKKLLAIPLALLIVLGGAYKMVLAKPAPAPKPKVAGTVYILPKDFLLNLRDGRFVKLDVALVLKPGAPTAAGGAEAAAPPDGFGTLPQEAVVRDIVTNTVTDASGPELISRAGRTRLKREILRAIEQHTDVEATEVLFTDVAVQ